MIIKSDFLNLAHKVTFVKKELEDVTTANMYLTELDSNGEPDHFYSAILEKIINEQVKTVLGYCLISPPYSQTYDICERKNVEITGSLEIDMKAIKKQCKANIKRIKQLIKQCIGHNKYVVELENKCVETNLATR